MKSPRNYLEEDLNLHHIRGLDPASFLVLVPNKFVPSILDGDRRAL